jgi:hypothetical protein
VATEWLAEPMRADRDLHEVGAGLLSVLGDGVRVSVYDRQARTYDPMPLSII